jgi:hypothetical protein
MKEDKELALRNYKETNRIKINLTLLGICFTLFTFLIAFNPDLLKNNLFLTLQLVCSIPLLMTSLLARSKASYTLGRNRWTNFGFITYLLGYSFLINVVGIFLIKFVSLSAGLVFFIGNILLALAYSAMEVSYDSPRLKERFVKDLTFILILVLLGILPAIGVY